VNAVVVYKANPESLQKVLRLLRKEGFHATTLENPGTGATLKWDKARQSEVNEMTGKLAGPFLLSVMAVGVLALVLLLLGILWDAVALLAVAWIAVFAVAANAEKIKLKVKGPKRR